MPKQVNHQPFIATGCLLWLLSFFGEIALFQPFSKYGMVVAPFVTLLGIVLWFINYKKSNGHYPRFFQFAKDADRQMRSNPLGGMTFIFSHLLKFWTVGLLLFMGIVILFNQSEAFQATKNHCIKDQQLLATTGEITGFGFLVGGNITGNIYNDEGSARLSFTIIGRNGNFKAKSSLYKSSDEWKVNWVEIK